ncbi:lipid A biosynthesis acyltransferase [Ancylomarina salipaludis]|uniref:Lipid A biosynthesis acyltransferase n=1 Tax=Ancylomarina salipaludis TaxID=2501299 RepID=A0A4Q1JRT3_9BACT|nr:lysophospholipid acyltransferase family protein [Ancylomarina salipaludis]RXQ97660.1 lipid A biosynthesis acyltransferase [Ancylomarina salipaludis]
MTPFFSYLAYAFCRFLSFLPLRVLYLLSDFVFFITYRVIAYRKKVVNQNLKNSFPEKTSEEIRKIRKEFYHHFCDSFVETIKLWNISQDEMLKRCVCKQPDFFNQYKEQGQSVVAVLGHYGNWEWLTSFAVYNTGDFLTIYKPLHNKVFDKMFIKIRERFGAQTLAKNDTLRTMIKHKNQGHFTITAFIGDQTPNRRNLHYWTNFLNQDTPILQGTERIAKKLDQAVVYVKMTKIKRGYYEYEFIPITDKPNKTEENEITELHTRLLENIIKEKPSYWLWSHKRWKHNRKAQS